MFRGWGLGLNPEPPNGPKRKARNPKPPKKLCGLPLAVRAVGLIGP